MEHEPNQSWTPAAPSAWPKDVGDVLRWAQRAGFRIFRNGRQHPVIWNPADGRSAEISGTPGGDVRRHLNYARSAIKQGLGLDDAVFVRHRFPGMVRTPEARLVDQLGSPTALIMFIESLESRRTAKYFDVDMEDGVLTVIDRTHGTRAREGALPVTEVMIDVSGAGGSWRAAVVETLRKLGIDLNLPEGECRGRGRRSTSGRVHCVRE